MLCIVNLMSIFCSWLLYIIIYFSLKIISFSLFSLLNTILLPLFNVITFVSEDLLLIYKQSQSLQKMMQNVSSSHLMNLSRMPSTHICMRMKLKPYLQSRRRKLMMNQSLSSNTSSLPSKMAIFDGTSRRWGIPYVVNEYKVVETMIAMPLWQCSVPGLHQLVPNRSIKCFMCRFSGWITEPPVSYSWSPIFTVARRPPMSPGSNTSIFTRGPNSSLR